MDGVLRHEPLAPYQNLNRWLSCRRASGVQRIPGFLLISGAGTILEIWYTNPQNLVAGQYQQTQPKTFSAACTSSAGTRWGSLSDFPV